MIALARPLRADAKSSPSAGVQPRDMTITPALLYRLSAWAIIVAFVLNLTGGLLHPVVDGNSHSADSLTAWTSPWAQLILLVGTVVQLVALPGVYAWIAQRAGLAGLIAFVTLYASLMLTALSHLTVEAFVSYELASDPALAHLLPGDGSLFPSTIFVTIQTVFGLAYMLSLIALGVVLMQTRAVPTATRFHPATSPHAAPPRDRLQTPSAGCGHRL